MPERKLTKKQQRVFDLLVQGKTPVQIGKAMRISSTAVYGHIRRMRDKGVSLPEGVPGGNGNGRSERAHPAIGLATNGGGQPEAASFDGDNPFAADLMDIERRTHEAVNDIDKRATARMVEIAEERASLQERLEALSIEEKQIAETRLRVEQVDAVVAAH